MTGLKTQRESHRTAATNCSTCETLSHSEFVTLLVTIRIVAVHNSLLKKGKLPVLILSHINTAHALPKNLNKSHFNIIPHLGASLRSRLFQSVFLTKSFVSTCNRPHPFHSSRFDYQDENWCGVWSWSNSSRYFCQSPSPATSSQTQTSPSAFHSQTPSAQHPPPLQHF